MRSIIPLSIIAALAITGCSAQRGRFVTSGTVGDALGPLVGTIDIVSGYSNAPGSVLQNLLYVVVICPGVQRSTSSNISEGGGEEFGKYVTTLDHTWDNSAGRRTVTVRWDRQSDTVSIGKKEFNREIGNLFIVRCEADGDNVGQQLTNLGPYARGQEVLQSISNQLPNDPVITTLTLVK